MKILRFLILILPALAFGSKAMESPQNQVVEWEYTSARSYDDPFNEIAITAMISRPDGSELSLPGFWAGGNTWRFRYSSWMEGDHSFRTICNHSVDTGLHNQTGTIRIIKYQGDNPLFKHGSLKVSEDNRHLEHLDGKPFLWLADSWWHGMTTRFRWPEDFKMLTADRKQKGFNVIQFAIAFPCDIEPFDPRGQNEAGDPWTTDFSTINPAYFDLVDKRVDWLVSQGMLPNIVGTWGYYMKFMGVEKLKRHWDYLMARYGAYPVTWTLCGESTLAYYPDLIDDWDTYKKQFRRDWSLVARHIQSKDPFDRLLTVHPGPGIHDGKPPINDMDALDFIMVQSGHSGFHAIPTAREFVQQYLESYPDKPVMHGEVCFEGMLGGGSGQKVQRLLFWSDMLSGTCGFSYGAEGIWQFNTNSFKFGESPGGNNWGNVPWEIAHKYPGSEQVGIGRQILEKFDWWSLQPLPDAVEEGDSRDVFRTYVAGIGNQLRIAYLYNHPVRWRPVTLIGLKASSVYQATYHDPITGDAYDLGTLKTDPDGSLNAPDTPIMQDWVLALQLEDQDNF